MQPYNKSLKPFSRSLRSNMTDAEQYLWQRIKGKQVCSVQFYRRKPLLSFIADFYCPRAKLVIELDGGQHLEAEHRIKDVARDEALAKLGIMVLRFDDRQVLAETQAVMDVIFQVVTERLNASTSNPS
ncbi:MAG: DUF559 domain-containing protein [Nitrosomonadales bacterium]|nr:DUF559 domain-containing protein [Nitrosomonadales bacterium]